MANKKYEEADVQAIAVAIREKTGSENTYNVSEMASGVNEVYDKGSTDGWDEFLNIFTDDGTKVNYQYAFCQTDFGNCTMNIKPKNIGYMFYSYRGEKIPKGIDCSEANVTGGSSVNSPAFICAYSAVLKEFLDMNIPFAWYWHSAFRDCGNLEKIEIMRVSETTTANAYAYTFSGCKKLKDITFEGVICVDISFSSSPLTVESMKSIITHLKNYSGTESEYAYTLTLKASCVTELETAEITDEDKNLLEEKGIVVSDDTTWVTVIDNLKWNLVTA